MKQLIYTTVSSAAVGYLLVALLAFLAYSNIFSNQFVGDDPQFILQWERTRTITSLPQLLSGAVPAGHEGVYRPVRSILYLISYQLWQTQPVYYHLFSVSVHILASMLVYSLYKLLTTNTMLALVAAGIFAVHPIHTEAITFITTSFDITGIVFLLAAIVFRLWAILQSKKTYATALTLASWILATSAYFSYEMTLTLPLLLAISIKLYKPFSSKRILSMCSPYLILAAVYLYIRFGWLAIYGRGEILGSSYISALLVTIKGWALYVQLLLWPVGLSINHVLPPTIHTYTFTQQNVEAIANQQLLDAPVLLASCILVFLAWVGWRYRQTQPSITWGIMWFFIALLPVSNLIPNANFVSEKYTYLASVGWIFAGSTLAHIGIRSLFTGRKLYWVTTCVSIGIGISLLYLTLQRNQDWQSEIDLWKATAAEHPNATVYYKLGAAYQQREQYHLARTAYQTGIAYNPQFAAFYHNLGLIEYLTGNTDEAISLYQHSIRVDPQFLQGHLKLGHIYQELDQEELAVTHFLHARRSALHDDVIADIAHTAVIELAQDYVHNQQYQQAFNLYQDAFAVDIADPQLVTNFGSVCVKLGKLDLAKQAYQQALKLDPNYTPAQENLINLIDSNQSQ